MNIDWLFLIGLHVPSHNDVINLSDSDKLTRFIATSFISFELL